MAFTKNDFLEQLDKIAGYDQVTMTTTSTASTAMTAATSLMAHGGPIIDYDKLVEIIGQSVGVDPRVAPPESKVSQQEKLIKMMQAQSAWEKHQPQQPRQQFSDQPLTDRQSWETS